MKHNARLRGWQRITLNSNTAAVTTAAHRDWKRRALTVPLEAFVMYVRFVPAKQTTALQTLLLLDNDFSYPKGQLHVEC